MIYVRGNLSSSWFRSRCVGGGGGGGGGYDSPFQRGDRLNTSESDVCGRQILTYKVDPPTESLVFAWISFVSCDCVPSRHFL